MNNIFNSYPDVLNVEDLQEALHISKGIAYKLLRENTIKSIRIGRVYKIPKIYLLNYLNELSTESED